MRPKMILPQRALIRTPTVHQAFRCRGIPQATLLLQSGKTRYIAVGGEAKSPEPPINNKEKK
jgi:hypothetical protein